MSSIYKALTGTKSKKNAESSSNSKSQVTEKKWMNKQRTLLISSRGVTYRHRHLISDLNSLLPHSRKEPKIDSKKKIGTLLPELSELYNCNNIMYFEARKHQDLYLWLSKPPNGPTIKFYLQNLHTLDELNFTGNCLKGSRPVLSFDAQFDDKPEFKLIKEMLLHNFGVPPQQKKSKPFIDHVMSFSIVDGKIWVRNYEIAHTASNKDKYEADDEITKKKTRTGEDTEEEISLVEIGPRFVMTPIVILEGCFNGPKIFENKQYVSPNVARSQMKQQLAKEAQLRSEAAVKRKLQKRENVLMADPLSNENVFN
ncbi:Ribosome biogenesis protein brx1 [Hanseniaspora osmophila]|uniref:Ribosome biogenesis protein BRX1 n=1 Tax=Hanseniaspora osmophila TaxID=56408 RepID=A0A1E5R095_9ASCO|nr:Ribosome biogenesis protein BRX1 [Hanseniaspora osmophila]